MLQHSDKAMAAQARTVWQAGGGFGAGRLGPMALHMAEDRQLACQVAIRSGGLTSDQINAVDFGKLGAFLRGLLRHPAGKRPGRSTAHGLPARHDRDRRHDHP